MRWCCNLLYDLKLLTVCRRWSEVMAHPHLMRRPATSPKTRARFLWGALQETHWRAAIRNQNRAFVCSKWCSCAPSSLGGRRLRLLWGWPSRFHGCGHKQPSVNRICQQRQLWSSCWASCATSLAEWPGPSTNWAGSSCVASWSIRQICCIYSGSDRKVWGREHCLPPPPSWSTQRCSQCSPFKAAVRHVRPLSWTSLARPKGSTTPVSCQVLHAGQNGWPAQVIWCLLPWVGGLALLFLNWG